jgi:hypothetical protein
LVRSSQSAPPAAFVVGIRISTVHDFAVEVGAEELTLMLGLRSTLALMLPQTVGGVGLVGLRR